MVKILCILGILACILILLGVDSVSSRFFDQERVPGNSMGAWVSNQWKQTTSTDFQAGQTNGNVDISSGTVTLSPIINLLGICIGYSTPGTIASQVLDTGKAGSDVDALIWNENIISSTDITFQVRASDTPFTKSASSPSWVSVGGTSPVLTGFPQGRYIQWRATLTQNILLGLGTPSLYEVRLYYH